MDYLPEEIVVEIMHQLPQGDLGRLTRTCRDLYRIGSEDHVWKKKGFLKRTADVAFAGSDSTPSPRLCHTSVTYANKMYIFGGHNTEADSQRFSEVRNDIFTFDFSTGAWQQLQAQGMPKKTEHSTVVQGDKLFMFGGYSGHTFSNSMYMLNLSTSDTCVHLKTKGELPSGRSAHVGVVFEDKYYMFGGWDGLVQNNDFFTFHFESSTWQRLNIKDAPHARCSHTAVVSPSRRALYVFGGFGGRTRNYLNDMWSFDFDTQSWTEIPTFGEIPSPRSRMRMVEFDDKLYIYGGWDKTTHFNELFEFDLETSTWRKIDIGLDSVDESFKIGQFSMSLNNNVIWIFGGYSSKMKKSSNELICYRLGQPQKEDDSICEKRRPLDKYDLSNDMDRLICA